MTNDDRSTIDIPHANELNLEDSTALDVAAACSGSQNHKKTVPEC